VASAPLSGRVALVTGGGRGIGAAAARMLARAGAAVAVAARSRQEVEAVERGIRDAGGRASSHVHDVADEDQVHTLEHEVARALGPVDVLVMSAGAATAGRFADVKASDWEAMMRANARSAFLCAREFAPPMAERGFGRVIAVVSIAGLSGGKYIAPYAASKHAVIGLVRCLAAEFAGKGVTVNAICPGYVDTSITHEAVAGAMSRGGLSHPEALAAILGTTGQDRLLTPEEVGDAVVKLAVDSSGATGQTVVLGARVHAV
jgi:NAD(P)-dependent dehydrogenase (short-subunit alcohol dehydrogenase family)